MGPVGARVMACTVPMGMAVLWAFSGEVFGAIRAERSGEVRGRIPAYSSVQFSQRVLACSAVRPSIGFRSATVFSSAWVVVVTGAIRAGRCVSVQFGLGGGLFGSSEDVMEQQHFLQHRRQFPMD
jgi:hypothetical protein